MTALTTLSNTTGHTSTRVLGSYSGTCKRDRALGRENLFYTSRSRAFPIEYQRGFFIPAKNTMFRPQPRGRTSTSKQQNTITKNHKKPKYFIKIRLKYSWILEFSLAPKGCYEDGLCRLKITLLGKCEGMHVAKLCWDNAYYLVWQNGGSVGETSHFAGILIPYIYTM